MIKIQENISLKEYTTFRIGGAARFFAEVSNGDELKEAVQYALDNKLGYFILGGGSNVLVSDKGFDGLVIKLQNTNYKLQTDAIECGAGLLLSQAVKIATENGLTGLEWAAGIPGTVGGAIRGNVGAYGGSMADSIDGVSVLVLDGGCVNDRILRNHDCKFGYRASIFKQNPNYVIFSATMRLQKCSKEEIENKIKEILKQRTGKIPQESSAGSFFMNPEVKNEKLLQEFEKETGQKSRGGKISAGWLIERAGLSGFQIGGAKVSQKHANFIVNNGSATAEDVVMLANSVKRKVRDELGVQLKEEVQMVGF